MTHLNENRVLSRRGAREIAASEAELVNGGFSGTDACSFIHISALTQTVTGSDCDTKPGDTDTDL